MVSFRTFLILPALSRLATAEFPLAGQLFQLAGASSVNNAKLAWGSVDGATQYLVEASMGNGAFQRLDMVPGDTHDLYGLAVGMEHTFRVTALNGNSPLDQSTMTTLAPYASQGRFNTYDNTQPSRFLIKSKLFSDGVYYRYNYESSSGRFSRFVEQTSSDGYTFSGDRTVLTNEVLCAPTQGDCKLEAISFEPNPRTGEFVMWAHYERSGDYALGYVAVAHTVPGQTFQFEGAYRPLGDDSRDMTLFVDGENAFIVTATNTNTNNNIYSLNADWTAVDQRLATVNMNGHREAPAIVKAEGWFYLFTSRASGWLPSTPQYIAAQNMAGPWSNPTNVANTATFCAQSGGINQLENRQFAMAANMWSSNWPTPGGPTRQIVLPISLAQAGGFASYHFYPMLQYSDDIQTPGQAMYGVQSGRILSVGRPSSSSAGTQGIDLANDGVQDTPDRFFKPSTVPFTYQIDLQDAYTISQIDLTTNLVQGSETFYQFTVEGSNDGNAWSPLADQSNNVNPGFVASFPTSSERFRYVRLNINRIVNNVNGNEADFASGLTEVTVYGG